MSTTHGSTGLERLGRRQILLLYIDSRADFEFKFGYVTDAFLDSIRAENPDLLDEWMARPCQEGC